MDQRIPGYLSIVCWILLAGLWIPHENAHSDAAATAGWIALGAAVLLTIAAGVVGSWRWLWLLLCFVAIAIFDFINNFRIGW